MQIVERIHEWTMNEPPAFGWFHILFLLFAICVTFLLIFFFKDCNEKIMKKIVFITWIGLVFFGIQKELIMSYSDNSLRYNWGSFPFQFCETPLYIYPLLILNKNKKLQNALITFISTYVFFAGFALMIYPGTLFSIRTILNIRTMYQHGSQMAIGLFLFAWNRKNINFKTFMEGSAIFLFLVAIATIINLILGPLVAPDYEVNMFFIAKDYNTNLMILKLVQPHVNWIIFIFLYILGFTFCAVSSLIVEMFVYKLIHNKQISKQKELEYNTDLA